MKLNKIFAEYFIDLFVVSIIRSGSLGISNIESDLFILSESFLYNPFTSRFLTSSCDAFM